MRIWIDATCHDERIEVFGMTILERLLRSLLESQRQVVGLRALEDQLRGLTEARAWIRSFVAKRLAVSEVRIELRADASLPADLPRSLLSSLPIVLSQGEATTHERLAEALRDADGEPLLALAADSEVDVRVLEHLVWANAPLAFFSGTGPERGAVVRLDGPLPASIGDGDANLLSIARACVEHGIVKAVSADEAGGYVRKLRRTLPGWLYRVPDRVSAAKVERFLFWSNYKGATDFLTKYVYPPLVWRAVVPLAQHRVHPNAVTALGIACCLLSVPLCAAGWWIPGLLLAYAMTVLDSVDGKLARLTFTSSRQGNVLDHGVDIVHPPLWYWGWAWGLSGGDPFSSVFQASLWLTGLYVTDRLLESLFKSCTGGRSVQDFTPLDVRLRTFVARRNVNLVLFTVGLLLGFGFESFYAVVALQLATAIYHLIRVVQYWDGEESAVAASPARVGVGTAGSLGA